LIEVDERELCRQVLESILKEDDENVEVWILLGHCHEQGEIEVCMECWERAEELLRDFLVEDPTDELFQAQLDHVTALLKNLPDGVTYSLDLNKEE